MAPFTRQSAINLSDVSVARLEVLLARFRLLNVAAGAMRTEMACDAVKRIFGLRYIVPERPLCPCTRHRLQPFLALLDQLDVISSISLPLDKNTGLSGLLRPGLLASENAPPDRYAPSRNPHARTRTFVTSVPETGGGSALFKEYSSRSAARFRL